MRSDPIFSTYTFRAAEIGTLPTPISGGSILMKMTILKGDNHLRHDIVENKNWLKFHLQQFI